MARVSWLYYLCSALIVRAAADAQRVGDQIKDNRHVYENTCGYVIGLRLTHARVNRCDASLDVLDSAVHIISLFISLNMHVR